MGSTRDNPDQVDADLLTAGGWQSFSDIEGNTSRRVIQNRIAHVSLHRR